MQRASLEITHQARFGEVMNIAIGMAKRSMGGGTHCGDACDYWRLGGKTILCLADGLGHGEEAEAAAKAAVGYIAGHLSEPLADNFRGCDTAIKFTRGVAMSIAVIDESTGWMRYAGIGNVRAVVHGQHRTTMPNGYGIVGAGYRELSTEAVLLKSGYWVSLMSDGVKEGLVLSKYDSVLEMDFDRLAAQIVEDFHNGRDDAAVLVAHFEGS